jgi:F0F1-type ATP synthase membrane subunit b/b'
VSSFALQIAEKLLRDRMADDKAQSQLVEKLLSEIETKN